MNGDGLLRLTLDRVYDAFSTVACPTRLDAAPGRNGDALFRALTSSSLRDLAGEKIGPYAGWAMTTVGTGADYQYFLPRILEVAIDSPNWMGTMPPVIASRLKMAEWTEWPLHQRDAVFSLFKVAFQWFMQLHTDVANAAPDWLCGLARLGASIEPQLTEWRQSSSPNASLQLASFVSTTAAEITEADAAFWDDVAPSVTNAVRSWLMGSATRAQLVWAISHVNEDDRWVIEHAIKLLQ